MTDTTVLEHPTGIVFVDELAGNRRLIRIAHIADNSYISHEKCETSYPLNLIRLILSVKGVEYLCDEILRDEDPTYVQRDLEIGLLSYVSKTIFEGKRILDFGCGSGASTSILARMFPTAEIVGVELSSGYFSIAHARVQYYGFPNVRLYQTPSGTEIPEEIGHFDFIVMSAVFEHLLPQERKLLMPLIWSLLKEDGYLFINQTPNRLFPVEVHTTNLPFLNYVPKWLALEAARRIQVGGAKRYQRNDSWEHLLREGIRGGTEREIVALLRGDSSYSPVLQKPCNFGLHDQIDVWHSLSSPRGESAARHTAKRIMKSVFKAINRVSSVNLVPRLTLAIKKVPNRDYKNSKSSGV